MNNLDALLFTAKCLTSGLYPERIPEVRFAISSGAVEWEKIVSISTAHLVFPALYLQLKSSGLLPLLPPDLVEYMEEFTALNRERNAQIIAQAREISLLLNRHNLTPVFIKGTAHLLDNLYKDIAERMVGDIDILVHETDMERAAAVLTDAGYKPLYAHIPENVVIQKHYPRLVKDGHIAAVEIHRQLFTFPNEKLLDCEVILNESRKPDLDIKACIPKDEHQVIYNILNVQLGDHAYYFGSFRLSQMYDLLHLSTKTDLITAVRNFGKSLHYFNSNLALSSKLMGFPSEHPEKMSLRARIYLYRAVCKINTPRWARFSKVVLYFALRLKNILLQFSYSMFNREMRQSVVTRLKDSEFYMAHIRSYSKK